MVVRCGSLLEHLDAAVFVSGFSLAKHPHIHDNILDPFELSRPRHKLAQHDPRSVSAFTAAPPPAAPPPAATPPAATPPPTPPPAPAPDPPKEPPAVPEPSNLEPPEKETVELVPGEKKKESDGGGIGANTPDDGNPDGDMGDQGGEDEEFEEEDHPVAGPGGDKYPGVMVQGSVPPGQFESMLKSISDAAGAAKRAKMAATYAEMASSSAGTAGQQAVIRMMHMSNTDETEEPQSLGMPASGMAIRCGPDPVHTALFTSSRNALPLRPCRKKSRRLVSAAEFLDVNEDSLSMPTRNRVVKVFA